MPKKNLAARSAVTSENFSLVRLLRLKAAICLWAKRIFSRQRSARLKAVISRRSSTISVTVSV